MPSIPSAQVLTNNTVTDMGLIYKESFKTRKCSGSPIHTVKLLIEARSLIQVGHPTEARCHIIAIKGVIVLFRRNKKYRQTCFVVYGLR